MQALDKLQDDWEAAMLTILDYRDTGTCVLKVSAFVLGCPCQAACESSTGVSPTYRINQHTSRAGTLQDTVIFLNVTDA